MPGGVAIESSYLMVLEVFFIVFVILKSRAFSEYYAVITPALHLAYSLRGVRFVVYHHVCPVTHISQCVDTLKVLFYSGSMIDQHIYDSIMTMYLLLTNVGKHPELWQY